MHLELSTAAFLMERERASKQKLFPLPRRFAIFYSMFILSKYPGNSNIFSEFTHILLFPILSM